MLCPGLATSFTTAFALQFCSNNTFYLKLLQKLTIGLWYSTEPVGHITLEKTVSKMFREATSIWY